MTYYVYDEFGDGYTTVSEQLPENYNCFIGEYSSREEALLKAKDYEEYIQDQVDKYVDSYYED